MSRISARSHREVMDWSLVLASQNIETTIDCSPDGSGWGLLVSEQDFDPAVQAIRLYRLENRRWPWRRPVFNSGFLFDWASLLWILLLCIFYYLAQAHPDLRNVGLMQGGKVSQGEWWRLFTAMWLHGDLAHLAGNATLGVVLLGLAMGRYGSGLGLLGAYLAGFGGNLAVWFLAANQFSLGASGMVMGSLGMLAVQAFPAGPRNPQSTKYLLTGFLGGLMLFVLLGLNPETDVRAHLGGFVSGICLGALLSLVRGISRRPLTNLLAAFAFLVLVLWPWYLAMRSSPLYP